MIDLLNLLGTHYATFGNHEFDFGLKSLKARLAGVDDDVEDGEMGFTDYPETTTKVRVCLCLWICVCVCVPMCIPPCVCVQWLMTNMTEVETGLPLGGERVARTALFPWGGTADGVGAVMVGLLAVSEDWIDTCHRVPHGAVVYEDFITAGRRAAVTLRAQGAEVVLALCHSRLDNDYKLAQVHPCVCMCVWLCARVSRVPCVCAREPCVWLCAGGAGD